MHEEHENKQVVMDYNDHQKLIDKCKLYDELSEKNIFHVRYPAVKTHAYGIYYSEVESELLVITSKEEIDRLIASKYQEKLDSVGDQVSYLIDTNRDLESNIKELANELAEIKGTWWYKLFNKKNKK